MLDFAYDKIWTRLEWQNVDWSDKTCVMRQELTFFTHPKFCNERYYAYKSNVSRLNAVSFKCYEWTIRYPLSYPLKFLKKKTSDYFPKLIKIVGKRTRSDQTETVRVYLGNIRSDSLEVSSREFGIRGGWKLLANGLNNNQGILNQNYFIMVSRSLRAKKTFVPIANYTR